MHKEVEDEFYCPKFTLCHLTTLDYHYGYLITSASSMQQLAKLPLLCDILSDNKGQQDVGMEIRVKNDKLVFQSN